MNLIQVSSYSSDNVSLDADERRQKNTKKTSTLDYSWARYEN